MTSATTPQNNSAAPIAEATPSLPKPRITWKGVGIATGFWLLYVLVYALFIAQGDEISFSWALYGQLVAAFFLGGYSLPVWWLTVRKMAPLHWGWVLGAHVCIAPFYAWLSLESYLAFFDIVLDISLRDVLSDRYRWIFSSNLTLYTIQFVSYHLVRNVQRLRLKEKQAAEFMALARERELEALKAQINPHFLFNTLNSISATLKRAPDQAREMIAKLAGLMRYALDSADRDLVSLREEVDFVRQYLDLEGHRFSDRLEAHVEIDAPEDTLETPVPPMVLQPLVENALKHGIAPSEAGGTVTVRVMTTNDHLRVSVEDTGVGAETEHPLSLSQNGTGLTNTSIRLEHTYGPDAVLQTASKEPSGFAVWFSIPLDDSPPPE